MNLNDLRIGDIVTLRGGRTLSVEETWDQDVHCADGYAYSSFSISFTEQGLPYSFDVDGRAEGDDRDLDIVSFESPVK